MEADYFIGVAQQALWVLALGAAPILIPALVAGVILGMVQAATSINEQTLSFLPRLLTTLLTLLVAGPWLLAICLAVFGGSIMILVADFTREIFARIPDIVR